MSFTRRLLLFFALLLPLVSNAQNHERTDSLVRLMNAASVQFIQENARNYRKAIDARFLHNDTYLSADTTLWDVDEQVIHFKGHVKLTQDETMLTSGTMDYLIDLDVAKFRGGVVELRDKQGNMLRTNNMDYNTKDSMGFFTSGGSMHDKDGQVIESLDGIYESKLKLFTFEMDVNMFTDTVFIRTRKLTYQTDSSLATFYGGFDAWKRGDMLSADFGWYNRDSSLFFFRDHVHGMTDTREVWADSLYFNQAVNDVVMHGNVQIKDSTRNVVGVSDYFHYQDSISTLTMEGNAAVAAQTEMHGGGVDTLYMGANRFVYRAVPKYLIPKSVYASAEQRLKDVEVDPVTEYRRKAAEAAQKAAEDAAKDDPNSAEAAAARAAAYAEGKGQKDAAVSETPASEEAEPAAVSANPEPAASASNDTTSVIEAQSPEAAPASNPDSLAVPSDTLRAAADSLMASSDTLAVPADTLTAPAAGTAMPADALASPSDSLTAPADTLMAAADSLNAAPVDSTKLGFLSGIGHVRAYRSDMQMACDSLEYCDIDSLARLFNDPIVWNDGNRQYSSDSLTVVIRNQRMDRASLMSNAFITIQEDSLCFDQIRGAEVMAYFDDSTSLKRFDALGGSSALFYLKENDAFATVNKVESKMLSALFKNGDIDRIFYFDNPKNDAYPVVQLPKEERQLKGFRWDPEKRPTGRQDITDIAIRPSEREEYDDRPQPKFRYTERYFPGHIAEMKKELARHDSLRQARRINDAALRDSLQLADSLQVIADSLLATSLRDIDSLAVADSLEMEKLMMESSLVLDSPGDTTAAAKDSLSAATPAPLTAQELREKKKAEREAAAAARTAAKEARWAELDARDAAKAAAKEEKANAKKRASTLKILLANRQEEYQDSLKRERYILKYQKAKARADARAAKRSAKGKAKGNAEDGSEIDSSPQAPEGEMKKAD
jgi:lipopolysaccharide export system protein LptA